MAITPGFNQRLRITREAAWGVRNPSPADSDVYWVEITQNTGFKPKKVQVASEVNTNYSFNIPRRRISDKYTVGGSLAQMFFPSQGALWKDAAFANIPTTPDVASYTFDYFNGHTTRSYLGGKCASWKPTSLPDSPYVLLATNWIFKSIDDTLTGFDAPALAVYPAESPYTHLELGGNFKLGNAPITDIESLDLTVSNTLVGKANESATLRYLQWCGRKVELSVGLTAVDESWRNAYESLTDRAFKLSWKRGTSYEFAIDLKGASKLSDWDFEMPLDSVKTESFQSTAYFDMTAGTDVSVSLTAPSGD